MIRIAMLLLVAAATSACSTTQIHSNVPGLAPTVAQRVQVLYSPPQRPYESIGVVSAKRYKPGFTDPSIADAIPQLQAAGAQLGADAVIVRSDRALNDRHVTVDAEAIRYTDGKPGAQYLPSETINPADCKACGTIRPRGG